MHQTKTKRLFIKKQLTKRLKYLIFPFLIFSLTVNEGLLYSQSSSFNYYQTSDMVLRDKIKSDLRLYYFGKNYTNKSILLFFLLSFIRIQHHFSQQVQIILKLQAIVYFKIDDFVSRYIHLHISLNSKRAFSRLYIV